MDWDADRKLDAVGLVLAVAILLSIGLLTFGAMQAVGDGGTEAAEMPDVEWSTEQVNDSHTRITHENGETLLPSELSVTVDGRERPTPFGRAIRPGDSAVILASDTDQVQLHWTGGAGERDLMYSQDRSLN